MSRASVWIPAVAGMTIVLLLASVSAQVQARVTASNDPALEARVKALSSELRCLVCQNQTVEDSSSPVARDMKDQVRTQLAAGKSEAEVKIYMTDRFGDFVLYKPPLKATTIVLWAGPFVALFFAGLLLVRRLRRSSVATDTGLGTGVDALSETDRARARALLHNNAEGATKP
jgi:cytochrome c-type biogenesis protein CcmH